VPTVLDGRVRLDFVTPADLDLDTADAMAALARASQAADGVDVTTPSGPTRLTMYQHSSDGTPFAGIWLARDGDRLLGYASAFQPQRENTDAVNLSGAVSVDSRREGVGRALLDAVLEHGAAAGRTKAYSGAMAGGESQKAMEAMGFDQIHTYAINRLDLFAAPRERWQRLYDEAARSAGDYELVRLVGATPDERVEDVVALFAVMADAPRTDPDAEVDRFDADRVRAYDAAMAARRQTVHRVMARHRGTGEWVGHTVLCVDEFDPSVGHQEDTSVVRAHRGHRLGLLLKADLLRWVTEERPEMSATETWNSTGNHHVLAVNEVLGTQQAARYASMRRVG